MNQVNWWSNWNFQILLKHNKNLLIRCFQQTLQLICETNPSSIKTLDSNFRISKLRLPAVLTHRLYIKLVYGSQLIAKFTWINKIVSNFHLCGGIAVAQSLRETRHDDTRMVHNVYSQCIRVYKQYNVNKLILNSFECDRLSSRQESWWCLNAASIQQYLKI